MKILRKRTLFLLFLFVWFTVLLTNFVREVLATKSIVRSRHNFFDKCNGDLTYRSEYLEACLAVESRPPPTNFYMDVFMEAVPRIYFFVFFEMNDLFTYHVIAKMVALAICKMMFGDLITLILGYAAKKGKKLM
jgi:hypothetical protein